LRTARVTGRCGVALAIALSPLLAAAPAHADGPQVVKTAWYWAEKTTVTPVTTLPTLPDQANAASGVPDGDLGVGYVLDQAASKDKMAAVDLDLTTIPVGSTFSSLLMKVPVDSAGQTVGTPDISACENIDTFTDGAAPQALSAAPPYAAPTCVKGVLANGAWTFDLTAMANEWSQGTPEYGVSLVPTLLAATDMKPFSTALSGKNAITVKATWSPPPAQTVPSTAAPAAPAVPTVAPPPALSGGGVVPAAPDAPAPAVVAPQLPAPQANPAPNAVAIRPAAYAPRSLTPSTLWWLAVLAVGALLALAWITQNDPLVPVAADPRRARFARAVRTA